MKKPNEELQLPPTGAKDLNEAIDTFKKTLAVDIQKACKSEETFTFLNLSADVFNRILKVITMFDSGKPVSALISNETEQVATIDKTKADEYPFDAVSKKIQGKINGPSK